MYVGIYIIQYELNSTYMYVYQKGVTQSNLKTGHKNNVSRPIKNETNFKLKMTCWFLA